VTHNEREKILLEELKHLDGSPPVWNHPYGVDAAASGQLTDMMHTLPPNPLKEQKIRLIIFQEIIVISKCLFSVAGAALSVI